MLTKSSGRIELLVSAPDKTKADYIERIMEAVIELEVTKGHLKWRMADLPGLAK